MRACTSWNVEGLSRPVTGIPLSVRYNIRLSFTIFQDGPEKVVIRLADV
jgi:hypothetical protein